MAKSRDLSSEYHWAIGRLFAETGKLDTALTNTIAAITGLHILHAIILVHHQQFANKLDSLTAVARIHFPDDDQWERAPLKSILDRTKAVGEFRNTLAHAQWAFDEGDVPLAVRFSARGKLKRSRKPVPLDEIREKTLEAIDLAGSLNSYALAAREWSKPDPEPET
jgi:hypothetical protein